MELIYYGHSCFAVKINDKHLLFDPFISENELANDIKISKIKADYIFISHAHHDHLADAVEIAQQNSSKIVSNPEICSWFKKQGISKHHPINIGGDWNFDFGNVKCTTAQHSSSLPDGSYGGNPMGFLVTSEKYNFYYAGDTGLTLDMQLIPKFWCQNLDVALLPIGNNYTMGFEDAIIAAEFIQCDTIIGLHFDTFGYIRIDHQAAQDAFAEKGKRLILPKIGETIAF